MENIGEINPEIEELIIPPVGGEAVEVSTEYAPPPEVPPPMPETVLERVIDAAENDEPLEKDMELRHERKGSLGDEQTAAASSVGQVLASSELSERLKPVVELPQGQSGISPLTTIFAGPSDYKQAVQWGFLAGLIVLVIVFLSYLLIH